MSKIDVFVAAGVAYNTIEVVSGELYVQVDYEGSVGIDLDKAEALELAQALIKHARKVK